MAPSYAQKKANDKLNVGIRQPYIRVVGIHVDTDGPGRTAAGNLLSPDEEEAMRNLAASANIYDTIAKSVAPSIYGCIDMKRAISCLLLGGSRKRSVDKYPFTFVLFGYACRLLFRNARL